MWWWLHSALAGDVGLYREALRLVEGQYRWPERIDHGAMFEAAAERLEARFEPLLVDATPRSARVRGIAGERQVRFETDLAAALAELEDVAREGAGELDSSVDIRAELLNGAFSTLDRYTTVLVGGALERFDERLSGTLTGIGVTLKRADGALVLTEVYPGTPAERAGLLVGDVVTRVDGFSTAGMVPKDAAQHIRGPEGSWLKIEVVRGGETLNFDVERAEVNIPNVQGRAGPGDIGVVRIDHFSERTVANLERVLGELRAQGLLDRGLILDLRGNSGGSLRQSAGAADAFVDAGRIVTTQARGGGAVPGLLRHIDATPRSGAPTPPIVVLIDHETASGAEILAGALVQLGRALVVGETSFGKGTVQTLHSLEADRLKLKMTAAEYVLANDVPVNEIGVVPDVALYPVQLGENPFWYADATRIRERLSADTPLLFYGDAGGDDPDDEVLRFAAALLSSGSSQDRGVALAGVDTLMPTLQTLQASRLSDGLRRLSLDWRAAPEAPGPADLAVRLEAGANPRAGEPGELRISVENRGGPLSRAALRLRSVNPDLDDRVVPIGRLEIGERRTLSLPMTPFAGSGGRTDRLVAVLECDRCEPSPVLDDVVTVESGPMPGLSATARWADGAVVVELKNTGSLTLTGLRARIPFAELTGVEFVPITDRAAVLAPGSVLEVRQPLLLGSGHPGTLPLELDVSADGVGRLASWPLDVPTSGVVQRLDAPVIVVSVPSTRLRPGTTTLSVTVKDADALDHIVVLAGGGRVDRRRWDAQVDWEEDKLLYRPSGGKVSRFSVVVPVGTGSNRVVILAEDKSGIRSRREVYLYGEGAADSEDGVAFANP